MSVVAPGAFLADQFPKKFWPLIPTTLRMAYAAAIDLVASNPILQIESARDNQGRLLSWSADLLFKRLIETGRLPFDYRWQPFARPTGRYLEIRLSHSVMTISQVAVPGKQPRNVRFRENGRLNNELCFNFPQFADEQAVTGLPHFLLVHGHQELTFSHLAVPHPLDRQAYSFRTPNLMNIPHAMPSPGPVVEDTDIEFDALELLKEDIDKWRKDHGEQR